MIKTIWTHPCCQGTPQILLIKAGFGGGGVRAENMNRCIWEKANSKVKSIFHNTKMQDINGGGGMRGEECGEEKGM